MRREAGNDRNKKNTIYKTTLPEADKLHMQPFKKIWKNA